MLSLQLLLLLLLLESKKPEGERPDEGSILRRHFAQHDGSLHLLRNRAEFRCIANYPVLFRPLVLDSARLQRHSYHLQQAQPENREP